MKMPNQKQYFAGLTYITIKTFWRCCYAKYWHAIQWISWYIQTQIHEICCSHHHMSA